MNSKNSSRSTLYNIEPYGISTGLVESMTSYITRLSEKHSVQVGDLVNQLIIPRMEKEYLQRSAIYGGDSFFEGAKTINGYTSNARDIEMVLANLTLREDLANLTLIGIEDLCATRGLLKSTLSWCPYCIDDSIREDKEVYYPLIWFVKAVKMCVKHQCLLVDNCPHCQKTNQILRRKMILGYCSHCWKRLDRVDGLLNETINKEKIDWYNFIYLNISAIIEVKSFKFSPDLNKNQLLKHHLNILKKKCFDNDLNTFAKFVDIPKNTLRAWINGDNLPSLEGILLICYRLNITLSNLLSELQSSHIKRHLPNTDTNKNAPSTRNFTPLDFKLIEQQLNKILFLDIPISMFEAAKNIGRDKRVLYSNFPELCKDISSRYKTYENSRRMERNSIIKKQIHVVVTALVEAGIKPTRVEVERKLNKNSLLRNPELKAYWQELTENMNVTD